MKPIIRWTIGYAKTKNSYQILNESIKNINKLYGDSFEYFVCFNDLDCYNDVDSTIFFKLKSKFKNIKFIRQKWTDCPLEIEIPNEIDYETEQKLNGSLWKICPPRLSLDSHEIIIDNDLIFLKKPKIINDFLTGNKNLIIKDSNLYMGSYENENVFKNEKQGYNSGVIGLCPGYDFKSDIINNFKKNTKFLNYGEEQGLLMYTLYKTNPLIGSSINFVGIHPTKIYLNCLEENFINNINKDKAINLQEKILEKIFSTAESVHFLMSNRKERHLAWEFYKKIKKLI
jgi:hypothetical protein